MLVLSRGINETVMVGDDVQVKVLAVDGLKVMLGFKAPKRIIVHREEIYNKIKLNQIKAINDAFIPVQARF